jgi:hypothetical protein
VCKAKEQLERYVGLFFIPIFEKDSWKTERKESLKASWALSRPMGSFSPIQNSLLLQYVQSFFY